MPWNDLASNQMVSYTDAQTSGATLKSGQSQFTSNQCMTRLDIVTKYNVIISDILFANNQLVPKGSWGIVGDLYSGTLTVGTIGTQIVSWGYGAASDTGSWGSISSNSVSFMHNGAIITGVSKYGTNEIFLIISGIPNSVSPATWTSISINNEVFLRTNASIAYSNPTLPPSQQWRRYQWGFAGNPFGTTVGAIRTITIK